MRQRGLSGIAEDIGEYQPPATDVEPVADESEKGNLNGPPALHSRPERSNSLSNAKTSAAPPSIERRESTSPTRIRHIDKALPPTPNEHAEDRVTTRNALEDTFLDTRPSAEGRPSIQSTRPSVRSTHTSHESKHKVKLGPRPSMDSFAGFHTQDWSGPIRPVSTLPNGVRLAARKQAPARSQSTRASPVIPETLKDPLPSQKPTSPVESKETPPPLPAGLPKQLQPAENRSSTMTPEKRRLKKALELRQKQLAARRAQELAEAEQSQGHPVQPSCDLGKRESLTATLPDLSPADDSTTDVLQERIEALDRNPDLVHVGPQNVDKGVSENFEVSPISLLEASDGPSTQASSVSDEEETPCNTDPTAPNEVISGSPVDASTHDQSISGNGTLLEPEHPLPDGRGDTLEPSGPDECKTERSISNMTAANQSDNHKEDALFSTAPRGSPDSSESKTSVQETADKVPLIGELSDSLDTRVSKPPRISSDRLIPHEIPLPLSDEEELGTSPEKKAIAEPLISNPHNEEVTRQHLAPDQTQEGNGGLRDSRSSIDDIPKEQCERRARRHGLVSPIKRVSSPDYSDEQFLSDDSFMEELKSATVQEAKPISVSKSPIMPVFPRSVSDSKSTEEPRPASASSDLKRPKRRNDPPMMPKLPDLYSARSSSAPYAPLHEAQLSSPTLKKVGVSSGISQRIKLLEQLSSRPTSPSSQLSSPSTALGSSPAFPSTRKTSFRASQAAAEIARSSTHNSKSRPQLTHLSKSRSPDRNSNRMTDGVFRIDVATKSGKARPESISVTARIVRGSHNRISEVPEGVSRPRTSDLYPSPLTVEHQPTRPTSPPLSPLKPPNPRYARSMSSTSTAPKSDVARRDSFSSRLSSTPSRRGSESELPRSMSDLSVNSMSNLDGSKDDKKESRKSRLFKRMSNISAASRRSIASALSPVRKDIKEEAIVEHHEPSRETIKPLAVEVGEVNIQFPDTLLWKRRHMKIEDEGILVLSASKSDNVSFPVRYSFHEGDADTCGSKELQNHI